MAALVGLAGLDPSSDGNDDALAAPSSGIARLVAYVLLLAARGAARDRVAMSSWNDPRVAPLFALAPNETTPVWLEVARRQASRRVPADLVSQRARDGFVQPSPLDLREAHRLDALALEAAREFDAVLLSPVAPLGVCSVLAPTSQDRTLSAARALEVVSDPTNVLALECARRLVADAARDVRLCTVHQTLRAQALPKKAGFTQHFRLFALGEAGRARADDGFEVDAVARHVATLARVLDACAASGHRIGARRATVLHRPERDVLATRVVSRLRAEHADLEIVEERFESRYYDGLRVLYGARMPSGDALDLGDTGVFDWIGKLTSNRKLRFVASGMGLQLVPFLFPREA